MTNKIKPFDIKNVTASIITELYSNGNLDKATLASIRGASSFTSQRAQAVWPIMMAKMEPEMLSRTGEPTYAEIAIYAALRFYAISQQGKDQFTYARWSKNGDTEGVTLFQVLANARQREADRIRFDRRIQPLLSVNNVNRVINELTHLVEMVKNSSQPIDYAVLASELYSFQLNHETANQVRLRWGQQYFYETN